MNNTKNFIDGELECTILLLLLIHFNFVLLAFIYK
jgi:hypothetical protein